jgi:hypothetical protein
VVAVPATVVLEVITHGLYVVFKLNGQKFLPDFRGLWARLDGAQVRWRRR